MRKLTKVSLVSILAIGASILLPSTSANAAEAASPFYTITDLGELANCPDDIVPRINSQGQISAWKTISDGVLHATILQGKASTDLGIIPDYTNTYAAAINDSGIVVGIGKMPSDVRPSKALMWQNGKVQSLETLGGKNASALAINAHAQIAGSAETADQLIHATLWNAGHVRDLGTLGTGQYSIATDINQSGDVTGSADTILNGSVHAFLWSHGTMQDLGVPFGATLSSARAINDKQEIVGWAGDASGDYKSVLWRKGHWTDLGSLGGDANTAWDINNKSQIVGNSAVGEGKLRAFLWENGTLHDLNELISPESGWNLRVASSINDTGQIVGRGWYQGQIHGFLLNPIDKP